MKETCRQINVLVIEYKPPHEYSLHNIMNVENEA
jgi:hypothetical protein